MPKLILVGLAGLLTAGCVPSAPPLWLVQPADPRVGSRSPRDVSVTSGLKSFGIVEPKDWREINRAVGPLAGKESRKDSTKDSGMGGSMGSMHGMRMGPKSRSGDTR